jgi:legumain
MLQFLIFIFFNVNAENFAIVVAGSTGWINYRHQSDVFHAFKLLSERGFDSDHLVCMAVFCLSLRNFFYI